MFRVYVWFVLFLLRIRFPKNHSLVFTIRRRYGKNAVNSLRKFEKLNFKNRKAKLDLEFLQACQNNNVIPNFLHFKLANKSLKTSEAYPNCQSQLLLAETREKEHTIDVTSRSIFLF